MQPVDLLSLRSQLVMANLAVELLGNWLNPETYDWTLALCGVSRKNRIHKTSAVPH